MSDISSIRKEIKNMKPHLEKKDVAKAIVKDIVPTELEAAQRAKNARKKAHGAGANIQREISMDIKKLSESFDFIEESCGLGEPSFEFFDKPQAVSESLNEGGSATPIIGRASGVFAPIGVMSRNNRIYDNDHYDYLLENQQLVDRISHRGMLGTIGHHDKKVDDQDLAEGKVSHVVTNLRIVEEADGTRNLYGTLEILDTPAGHLLKTYYDSDIPLFVSSRGGGNLLPVPNESYKRVDKTKYFLETFDIVKNPGFLQAKPVYEKVSEGLETPEDFKLSSILHKSISEEEIAIAEYEKRSGKCKEHGKFELAMMFKELADDEKVHAAQLREALKLLDLNNPAKDIEGEQEAKEVLGDVQPVPMPAIHPIDALIESVDKLVSAISESKEDKKEKAEDDEKKETKEKKEAKEAKEAPEAKEAGIVEECKCKDKKKEKPADEENEDAEDAVADSVDEAKVDAEGLTKKEAKAVNKIMNPHANMTKKDIANGNEQTKLFTRDEVKSMIQDASKVEDAQKKERKGLLNQVKQGAKQIQKREQVAQQLKLGLDEDVDTAIDKHVKDPIKNAQLHNKVMLNKNKEITTSADREAQKLKDDPKYRTEKNQTYTQASPYSDALDNINRRRTNANTEADRRRLEFNPKRTDSDRTFDKIKRRIMNAKEEMEAMPIQPVQAIGDSTKSAAEPKTEYKEPIPISKRGCVKKALQDGIKNDKKVEK